MFPAKIPSTQYSFISSQLLISFGFYREITLILIRNSCWHTLMIEDVENGQIRRHYLCVLCNVYVLPTSTS